MEVRLSMEMLNDDGASLRGNLHWFVPFLKSSGFWEITMEYKL